MNGKRAHSITRREFARRAAAVTATSLVPAVVSTVNSSNLGASVELPQTPVAQNAEAEARYRTVLTLYESRFTEEQKVELRRLCNSAQLSLDRLRSYPIENSVDPALFLKPLIEHERKPDASNALRSTAPASH